MGNPACSSLASSNTNTTDTNARGLRSGTMPAPSGRAFSYFPNGSALVNKPISAPKMLGDLGFNAFVVDVYGKGICPNTPETCQAEMMKYATNRPLLRERAR